MKISFQGEISQQEKHEAGPRDQKDYGKNTSSIKDSMKRLKSQCFRFNPTFEAAGYKARRSQREEMQEMLKKDRIFTKR